MRWKYIPPKRIKRWFAWHPVRLVGSNDLIWWEWVYKATAECQAGSVNVYGETEGFCI